MLKALRQGGCRLYPAALFHQCILFQKQGIDLPRCVPPGGVGGGLNPLHHGHRFLCGHPVCQGVDRKGTVIPQLKAAQRPKGGQKEYPLPALLRNVLPQQPKYKRPAQHRRDQTNKGEQGRLLPKGHPHADTVDPAAYNDPFHQEKHPRNKALLPLAMGALPAGRGPAGQQEPEQAQQLTPLG